MNAFTRMDLMEPRHVGNDPLPRSIRDDVQRAGAIIGAFHEGEERAEWWTGDLFSKTRHSELVTDSSVEWARSFLAAVLEDM